MNHLVSQALEHEFPGGPAFRGRDQEQQLKKVFEVVSGASDSASTDRGRPWTRPSGRCVRSIANPLKLGEMGLDATHFVLGQHWKNHFTKRWPRRVGRSSVDTAQWIDEPKPMGLPREAENLVILIYALQTNQSFFIHSAPWTRRLGQSPRPVRAA